MSTSSANSACYASPNTAPQEVDTLIHARWILPMCTDAQGQPHLYKQHSLVIHGQRILDILPTEEAKGSYLAAQVYQLDDHLLLPGLINLHGHAAMSLFRGLADDLPLMTWLNEHIWPAEKHYVNEDFVRVGTQLAIAEMLRTGTTYFSDMYFFPEVSAQVANDIEIRMQATCPLLDFPTNWAQTPADYLRQSADFIQNWQKNPWVRPALGPHAPYSVGDNLLCDTLALQKQTGVNMQMHVHETEFEVQQSLELHQQRPLARLARLGALSAQFQAVHMTQIDAEDLALLQQHQVSLIHCPQSNLKLASGFCPLQQVRQAGVLTGLGTDGAASNNDLDLWSEMQTAALLAKGVAQDASALPAYEALKMATIDAAHILGEGARLGSLELDKQADICAVRLQDLESLPLYQPVSHLVYTRMADKVSHVWVAGKLHVDEGELLTLDERSLKEDTRRWALKIANTGHPMP